MEGRHFDITLIKHCAILIFLSPLSLIRKGRRDATRSGEWRTHGAMIVGIRVRFLSLEGKSLSVVCLPCTLLCIK